MANQRQFQNAKLFIQEAKQRIKDYDAIMKQTRQRYDALKKEGIKTDALPNSKGEKEQIVCVTNKCWKHVFEHKKKRRSEVERLARALTFQSAIKLLEKATTYQERSHEDRPGERPYLSLGVIGYIRGNRIQVLLKRDYKNTASKIILHSFFQLSPAPKQPIEDEDEDEQE